MFQFKHKIIPHLAHNLNSIDKTNLIKKKIHYRRLIGKKIGNEAFKLEPEIAPLAGS